MLRAPAYPAPRCVTQAPRSRSIHIRNGWKPTGWAASRPARPPVLPPGATTRCSFQRKAHPPVASSWSTAFAPGSRPRAGRLQLTRHHFAPDVLTEADARIEGFTSEPWPTVHYVTNTGLVVIQELFVVHGSPTVLLRFRLQSYFEGVTLCLRPFLSGRDFHSLQHENAALPFRARATRCAVALLALSRRAPDRHVE